jgi:hypothetical protein
VVNVSAAGNSFDSCRITAWRLDYSTRRSLLRSGQARAEQLLSSESEAAASAAEHQLFRHFLFRQVNEVLAAAMHWQHMLKWTPDLGPLVKV